MARLSQLFMPREREFYDLFEEAAANIVRAAAMLEEMLEAWPEKAELAREILLAEQEGDRITQEIVRRLNVEPPKGVATTDLYALATTLHHLLTGQSPPDAVTRATDTIDGEPDPLRPPHEINPESPVAISDAM